MDFVCDDLCRFFFFFFFLSPVNFWFFLLFLLLFFFFFFFARICVFILIIFFNHTYHSIFTELAGALECFNCMYLCSDYKRSEHLCSPYSNSFVLLIFFL